MGDLQSIDELKNLEQRFAKLESENASLCTEIAELRPKPAAAPKPPIEQQTVVTYPTPFASVVMPSNEQLIALANIVVGIHPELSGRMGLHRATDEENEREWVRQFEMAFLGLGSMGRTAEPDRRHYCHAHKDVCESI